MEYEYRLHMINGKEYLMWWSKDSLDYFLHNDARWTRNSEGKILILRHVYLIEPTGKTR